MIKEFIEDLKLVKNKYPTIVEYDKLYTILEELDRIIGMEDIKKDIISTIQYTIIKTIKNKEDDHMFHFIISGPPGLGKTTIINIMAKIYALIGIIDVEEKIETENPLPREIELSDKLNSHVNSLYRLKSRLHTYRIDPYPIPKLISDIREAKRVPKVIKKRENVKVTFLKRQDLVAEYVGQTAIKTRNAILAAMPGIIVIDEAYSLINCKRGDDSFGSEALCVINEACSLYPKKLLFAFAGYEDLINNTIFKAQPGLKRRFRKIYTLKSYKNTELTSIFLKQLGVDDKLRGFLNSFFKENLEYFPHFGGDTEILSLECKVVLNKNQFKMLTKGEVLSEEYTKEVIEEAFSNMCKKDKSEKEILSLMFT